MQCNMTALHHAAVQGHVEVAKALLEKGAATDLTDEVSLLCTYALCIICFRLGLTLCQIKREYGRT